LSRERHSLQLAEKTHTHSLYNLRIVRRKACGAGTSNQ
jgi:hypothetical protein